MKFPSDRDLFSHYCNFLFPLRWALRSFHRNDITWIFKLINEHNFAAKCENCEGKSFMIVECFVISSHKLYFTSSFNVFFRNDKQTQILLNKQRNKHVIDVLYWNDWSIIGYKNACMTSWSLYFMLLYPFSFFSLSVRMLFFSLSFAIRYSPTIIAILVFLFSSRHSITVTWYQEKSVWFFRW